jgi:hypothetical protein
MTPDEFSFNGRCDASLEEYDRGHHPECQRQEEHKNAGRNRACARQLEKLHQRARKTGHDAGKDYQ